MSSPSRVPVISHQQLGEMFNIEPCDGGFRIWSDDEWTVEVHAMIYNWRAVAYTTGDTSGLVHGFCYFGTGIGTLMRAVQAAREWQDPLNTKPTGFDKQAF